MLNQAFYVHGAEYLVFQLSWIYFLYFLTRKGWVHVRFILIYTAMLKTVYIIWRAAFTLILNNVADFVTSVLLFCAEFLGYVQQMIFYRLTDEDIEREYQLTKGYSFIKTFLRSFKTKSDVIHIPHLVGDQAHPLHAKH